MNQADSGCSFELDSAPIDARHEQTVWLPTTPKAQCMSRKLRRARTSSLGRQREKGRTNREGG